MLSLNDATLAALVPSAIQAASAATRAADLTQTKLKECLDALDMLSGHLKRHSEITSAVAVEMRRQPACQELAIERELVAGIQAEAAQRAAHISRLRGHCTTLTPFSQALTSLKTEAALKLQRLSKSGASVSGAMLPTTAAAQVAAAAPTSNEVTTDRLDNIERGLHAMNAHVNQLVRLQSATAAAAPAALPFKQAVGTSNAAKATRRQPVETSPEAIVAPPPRILEISPGGTEQPEIIRSLSYKVRQEDEEGREESHEREQSPQQQQQQKTKATSKPIDNPSTKRRSDIIHFTQSKALRGDAAPSSTSEDDDCNRNGSSGANNRSLSPPDTNLHSAPASIPLQDAGGKDIEKEIGQRQEFCFKAPIAGGSGKKQEQQEEEEEEPSPTPQVAPNNPPCRDANNEKGSGAEEQQFEQYEKENIDATQSQGDASTKSGGSKQGAEKEDGVPATLPLEEDAEEEAAVQKEESMDQPAAAVPATGAGNNTLPGRNLLSQIDSYSPGNTPGSGGAHTGSGSGSGVAAAAAAAAAARGGGVARAGGLNEDTPAGPSRVAPTPVSLLCCPPPLPPPSFPSSSSLGAAAAGGGGGGGEKRHYYTAVGGGTGGASVRVKRTRFATEAAAFERERSSSQDADAEDPLSGPSSGSGGPPGTADWKTPGEVNATPLHQTLYHMQYYHQHKSWVPSTIKPAAGGPRGGGIKGNQPPLFGCINGGGDHDQLFPLSQEDSPRVAGAQKGATPMFLNSFPSSGDLGGHNVGGAGTPATCTSWKAGVARTGIAKVDVGGSDIIRHVERRKEVEEDQRGEEDGCNASNQLRRKTPGS